MFRCQFSGQVSEPAVYKTVLKPITTEDGRQMQVRERILVSAAEKPVRVVIEVRARTYENWTRDEETGRKIRLEDTQGFEIARELLVRPRHVAAVKEKYGIA